jgi:predicted Zn-ribbon and HTH transcriptional regulator
MGVSVQTIRRRIIELLAGQEMTARELSQDLGLREKEVYDHLVHLGRTVAAQGRQLVVRPFGCRACGWVFKDRRRFSRPGRCPRCKGSYIEAPAYRIS